MRTMTAMLVAGAIVAPLMGSAAAPALAAEELRSVAGWASTFRLVQGWFAFKDHVNATAKGAVEIKYLGGPEVVPSPQQGQAVRSGFVDLAYIPPSYYVGLIAEADGLIGRRKSASEIRANGGLKMMQEIWASKMNVHLLGLFDGSTRYHLYLSKEPKITAAGLPDFTGLKIRVTPTYRPMVRAFNATGVGVAPAEVFNAFERGLVDGLGWPQIDFMTLKVDKFIKFKIEPPMLYMTITPLINLDKWNALPAATRALLDKTAAEWEISSDKKALEMVALEAKEMAAAGIKPFKLPPKAAAAFEEKAYEGAWEAFDQKMPEVAAKLKQKLM